MKKFTTEYGLIEYMLTLLQTLDQNHIDVDQLMRYDSGLEEKILGSSQEFQMAYEVIRFMDEMPGGFFIYHADAGEEIIYANKALLRIFRCDTMREFRELTGNSFQGIVHPEDLDSIEESIREQITASQYDLDYVEYRIIRKDGSVRWVDDYGHFIHSEAVGDIFYVFIGDATEKRKRQLLEKANWMKEKKRKEQKMQMLMDEIEEYDQERKLIHQEHLRRLEVIKGLSVNYESILYADLETDQILPYRLSSRTKVQFGQKYQKRSYMWYIEDYVRTWVHPEEQDLVLRRTLPGYIKKKLLQNKTFYFNYRIQNKGEVQYLQLRIVNVGNEDQISQIVMGYRRVDEEVQRELEQKQILEEALNNANLAIVAKNTFLSNMSHDMRTPLNAIFGYTALARKNINDRGAVSHYLDKIEESSRQFLELIDKVLEISWTETRDTRITETECNLNDILTDITRHLGPQASKKEITITLNTDTLEDSNILADREKLRQIFLHLSGNAITYTRPGGNVDITVKELEKPVNHYAVYQFEVKDNGIGISEEFLAHIFEPFAREKNTTYSGVHGTGVGLTIVKHIVELMDGNIEVASEVDQGTVFTVTLRLRIQNKPLAAAADMDVILDHIMGRTILLVEDNEINIEIETEILNGLGFHLKAVTDGKMAVDTIRQSEPGEFALILMDIQMPVMDGWQATREIRQLSDPVLSQIPIIALSADAFESDEKKSIQCGMDAHLTKPIDIPLLLDTMGTVVHHHETISKE